MKRESEDLDLFCRVNIQSELSHADFVAFIGRLAGGAQFMNSVKSAHLDIAVDDNDEFDSEKANQGNDRWLYFRYTLEIDPIESVAPEDYIVAVGNLLKSLWSSQMDAVAACDFEDQLPQNKRRMKWGEDSLRVEIHSPHMIAATDSIISPPVGTNVT